MNTKTKPMARLRLRDILKSRKITQSQFAQLSGLSEVGITRLAGTPRQIHLETIAKICASLEITPDDLIEITTDEK